MKKVKSKVEISPTESTLSNDDHESPPEKIVLPDECGDSLWKEVLAQKNNDLLVKKANGNKVLATSVDKKK